MKRPLLAVVSLFCLVMVVTGHAGVLVGALVLWGAAAWAWHQSAYGTRTLRLSAGSDYAKAALHEAGHKQVAQGTGTIVVKTVIRRDGSGYTKVRRARTIVDELAICYAGGIAANEEGSAACSGDRALVRWYLRMAPHSKHAELRRQGHALAVKLVNKRRGKIEHDADRLVAKGRI